MAMSLLGRRNITVTQQHYSPWIGLRPRRLGSIVRNCYTAYRAEIPTLPAVVTPKLLSPAPAEVA